MTRPRDVLGRPLRVGDPRVVAGVDPDLTFDDGQAWQLALGYLDRGMPFHAHEVFELRWRQCPSEERRAWQALAQWAAALTHEARGHPDRAARMAATALSSLEDAQQLPAAIDVARVQGSLRALTP